MRTLATTVLATAALAAAGAAPAHAGTVQAYASTDGNTVTCAAVAQPDPIWTQVADCYVRGLLTSTRWHVGDRDPSPGAVDVVAGARLGALVEPYEVCVRGRAQFSDGSFAETPLICTTN